MSKTIGIFLIASAVAILGSYFLVKRFLRDRQAAMGYRASIDHRMVERQTTTSDGRTVKTYTAQELEEARKKGQLPKGMEPVNVSVANAANEAAVQRSLRTIEEINKINQMNQRLMEQQQRMQKQNK